MLKISRFLKFEVDIIVARNSLNEGPIIFFHPNFAKKIGVKENDVVQVSRGDKSLRLKVKISEFAPEDGAYIPNGIFASYLTEDNFKKFKAYVEVVEEKESSFDEIFKSL